EQRRRDGPLDEDFREVHRDSPSERPPPPPPGRPAPPPRCAAASPPLPAPPTPPAPPFGATRALGVSRSCPSVTTTSPGVMPLAITELSPCTRATVTGRICALA